MPRKKNTSSKAAKRLFANIQSNIKSRLKSLGVTPYRASVYSGHNDTWLSDAFRRSSWVSIAWLADVSEALNVPAQDLVSAPKEFQPEGFEPPGWMDQIDFSR